MPTGVSSPARSTSCSAPTCSTSGATWRRCSRCCRCSRSRVLLARARAAACAASSSSVPRPTGTIEELRRARLPAHATDSSRSASSTGCVRNGEWPASISSGSTPEPRGPSGPASRAGSRGREGSRSTRDGPPAAAAPRRTGACGRSRSNAQRASSCAEIRVEPLAARSRGRARTSGRARHAACPVNSGSSPEYAPSTGTSAARKTVSRAGRTEPSCRPANARRRPRRAAARQPSRSRAP